MSSISTPPSSPRDPLALPPPLTRPIRRQVATSVYEQNQSPSPRSIPRPRELVFDREEELFSRPTREFREPRENKMYKSAGSKKRRRRTKSKRSKKSNKSSKLRRR